MVYGDGDGYKFSPLGNSLDVVAHELKHGVNQYSAGLVYSYQSEALNESYSDVFGAMVDYLEFCYLTGDPPSETTARIEIRSQSRLADTWRMFRTITTPGRQL